jgi:hypothetical protein
VTGVQTCALPICISIKSIFCDHWKSIKLEISRRYESFHRRSIVESVKKMLSCREPSSGYAEYICTHCGAKKKSPFTCKGRFCTSCGKKYTDEWVQRTVDELLDEKDSAKGKAREFPEGPRWASQLSLFPV